MTLFCFFSRGTSHFFHRSCKELYEKSADAQSLYREDGDANGSFNIGVHVENTDTGASYVRINGSSYVYSMSGYYTESVSEFDLETLKYVPEETQTETE